MFNANPDKYKIWSNYQPSAEKNRQFTDTLNVKTINDE